MQSERSLLHIWTRTKLDPIRRLPCPSFLNYTPTHLQRKVLILVFSGPHKPADFHISLRLEAEGVRVRRISSRVGVILNVGESSPHHRLNPRTRSLQAEELIVVDRIYPLKAVVLKYSYSLKEKLSGSAERCLDHAGERI